MPTFTVPTLKSALRAGASLAAAVLASVAPALASAHGRGDGLLAAPPAHAPAGVCYAHVTAAAEYGPPPEPGAHWRLSPPPPGAPGPVWCLVFDPAAPAPLIALKRDGWIRVLCDADQTAVRISSLQRRLHGYGDYAGSVTGRYDAATAGAVARFQRERRIAHGGYLSLRTVEAIEAGEAARAYPAPAPVAYIPPPPPPVVILPAPRPPPSPWLVWPGKTMFAAPQPVLAGACGGCVR